MIHLIAFARISGKQYAYDYVVSDNEIDKVIQKQNKMIETSSEEAKELFTTHVIKAQEGTFKDIQKKDPYFSHTILCESFESFLSAVNSETKLSAKDVASYLLRRFKEFNNRRFALHKVLYYIYADYLVKNRYPLFSADFVAFDKGPVEYDIYRMEKYQKNQLLSNHSFELKVQLLPDCHDVLQLIKDDVDKYEDYYQDIWSTYRSNNPNYNITHKNGTPWYVARNRGRNSSIKDADIVKYHKIEVLN